jgi:microsomal dipeptidase-like Zn-dependent dipeptidase
MDKTLLILKLWADYKNAAETHHLCSSEFKAFRKIPYDVFSKTLLSIGEGLLGYWDTLVKDGWGSLNPRALHPEFRDGTIREGFKRTWIGPAPVGSEMKIVVKKRIAKRPFPGTLGGTILVEKYDEEGAVVETRTITFEDGTYEAIQEIAMSDDSFGFLMVTVDTPHKLGKSFAYSIKYEEVPVKSNSMPVKGFADIHVHQTAEYAYAGNWLHGSMMGDPADILKPCIKKDHSGKLINLGINKEVDEEDPADSIMVMSGDGFPGFSRWPHHLDIAHQQVHETWLKQAFEGGMKLMVSSAVNSEILSLVLGAAWDKDVWRDMNSIEKQIAHIHDFCEQNSDWIQVAYNPWQARELIHDGKMALVIAVECSNLFPPDKGHYTQQLATLYCMGVRSIQIVHHCDNRYAGAAPQERAIVGIQTLSRMTRVSLQESRSNIMDDGLPAYFSDDLDKPLGFEFDSEGKNVRGLSEEGRGLIKEIMNRHMLIDVAHYSARAFEDVYELARANNYYPLFVSHTKFWAILDEEQRDVQREFLTIDDQIQKINDTGGIVGLRTAPWSNQNSCCGAVSSVATDGTDEIGTARNYAQQVFYAYKNGMCYAFGSDFNGFTNQLGPRNKDGQKPDSVSWDYWENGLRHIGLLPDLVSDLKALETPGAGQFDDSAEKFLHMWERTWDDNRDRANTIIVLPGGEESLPVRIENWAGADEPYVLTIDLSAFHGNVDLSFELKAPKVNTPSPVLQGMQPAADSWFYHHYDLAPGDVNRISNLHFEQGTPIEFEIIVRAQEEADFKVYELPIVEQLGTDEVRAVTRYLKVTEPNYIGNKNTLELHRESCIWVEKMNVKNKRGFQSPKDALKLDYDGCYFCLLKLHFR